MTTSVFKHTHTHTEVSLLLENCVCFPNLFNHSFMKSVRPFLGKRVTASASKIPATRTEQALNVVVSSNGKKGFTTEETSIVGEWAGVGQ